MAGEFGIRPLVCAFRIGISFIIDRDDAYITILRMGQGSHADQQPGDDPNRVRIYSFVFSGDSFTVPGPLRTKKSPSGFASTPFHFRKTASGLRWQLTTHTVLPRTIWVFGSMQVPARSPSPLRTTCAKWRM